MLDLDAIEARANAAQMPETLREIVGTLANEIRRLRADADKAYRRGVEDAAKVCDDDDSMGDDYAPLRVTKIAVAIRALADKG